MGCSCAEKDTYVLVPLAAFNEPPLDLCIQNIAFRDSVYASRRHEGGIPVRRCAER